MSRNCDLVLWVLNLTYIPSAGLSADSPLKEAMVGVELLIARIKTWQDHNASEREGTSVGDLEPAISGLAARWRRLELASWRTLIDRSLCRQRELALTHWFHLYSILFTDPLEIASVLPVLEEFLQTCTLGQFCTRLSLLDMFSKWCAVLATGSESTERQRLEALSICLSNVGSYYGQHVDAVERELEAGLADVRKELRVISPHHLDHAVYSV